MGRQASYIIYFYECAYAVAYGAYWIAPIDRGNTARNGASPLFWRVYALHTPRVSYGMTEDIKRFDMEIQLLKDIDEATLDRMSVWLYTPWPPSCSPKCAASSSTSSLPSVTAHRPLPPAPPRFLESPSFLRHADRFNLILLVFLYTWRDVMVHLRQNLRRV